MTTPGSADNLGRSKADTVPGFQVPTTQADGKTLGGTARDMGSLALFLVANWFVNGETVLIDGGVGMATTLLHP